MSEQKMNPQAAMFELHTGDCIDVLKTLPDGSVDSVVTSPPYAMQRKHTYGGVSEKDYPAWTVAWMREVWRVLKDDGSVIINISPHIKNGQLSTQNRKKRSSSSSVRTGTSLHGNLLTCRVYLGDWLRIVCESIQKQNL